MSFRISRRLAVPLSTVAVVSLALTACGGGTTKSSTAGDATAAPSSTGSAAADPNAPLKEGLKIAFLPKQLNNPYTDVEVGGGKAAVGEPQG